MGKKQTPEEKKQPYESPEMNVEKLSEKETICAALSGLLPNPPKPPK